MTPPRVTPDEWRHVEEIFLAALEKDGDTRSQYLDEVCRGKPQLRAEVESLLAHAGGGTQGLAAVVSEAASKLPASRDRHIDSKIGPYRILRRLDEGGMGVVYLAERSDEHYLQTVAIKLVKSGMDSREIVNRFRAERQILANLTHPNIAAILDGGSTEDGLPYIVMEYIGGQPITEFAGARQLSVRERIQLFLPVCLAVHYAHQKLVIHRDIKPGNILVTAEGNPKLLDFGIAKLLADDSPIAQGLTITGMRAMTPDYSSPEQIRGESLSTSTDVYSLGVVLFELLTGSHPYSAKGLTPSQLEHLVCAGDRGKPSETAGLPNRLARELRGDLDNIVLMALRTEPERRYKSAEQLAEDLSRYLSGQPVIARTDTPFYRAGKFFRRHWTGTAAVLAILATMAVGTIVAVREARMAQARADDMQKLIEAVVVKTNDDLTNLPQSTEVRATMLKAIIDNLDALAKNPDIPPKLLMEISGAYVQAGTVQGLRTGVANVGHEEEALHSMEKAVQVAEQAAAKGSSDPDLPHVRLTPTLDWRKSSCCSGIWPRPKSTTRPRSTWPRPGKRPNPPIRCAGKSSRPFFQAWPIWRPARVRFTSRLQTIERRSESWSPSTPEPLRVPGKPPVCATEISAWLSLKLDRSRPRLTLIAPRQRFVKALSSSIRRTCVTRDGSRSPMLISDWSSAPRAAWVIQRPPLCT